MRHPSTTNEAIIMRLFSRVLAIAALSVGAFIGCGDDADDASGGAGGGVAAGSIQVQVSGEESATDGFLFPDGSEVVIADGWEVQFDHVFVVVGRVWLSDNPDTAPSDQSQTGGVVAERKGPWAIDLASAGSVPGAGGEGTAIPLVVFDRKDDGSDFEADQRYAFSYGLVTATDSAERSNFAGDASAEDAYARMVDAGYTVFYVGTATFEGTTCESSDDTYDFEAIPTSIPFAIGFSTPTEYLNCQNQENQGEPFDGEEFQRGIAIVSNDAATAQLTFHLEHPFYSDVAHEPLIYFDQLAARLVGAPEGTELTLEMLEGVDPTAFTDGSDNDLPWRSCDGSTLPAGAQRRFETGSIPVNPGGEPESGFRDYRDYVHYVQSSFGHLNGGEGLCFIDRQYASPP
jgi:hypothetical protein